MNIGRSFFTLAFVSLMYLGLLVLGVPVSGFAGEPHVCISNVISTAWQNLNNSAKPNYTFVWADNCGSHTSNTTRWRFRVYNYSTTIELCNNLGQDGNGYIVIPDGTQHTYSLPCSPLPTGATAKIKTVVEYQVIGSGWMPHNDFFYNK